uniref:Uncharacterized protein n=1 Tax=Tanacetum cinerariifolium TaxID=118510 RepID=A0A699HGT6_TANCI|nr:hypothetical protein [Tanacetum cinerariifolium]
MLLNEELASPKANGYCNEALAIPGQTATGHKVSAVGVSYIYFAEEFESFTYTNSHTSPLIIQTLTSISPFFIISTIIMALTFADTHNMIMFLTKSDSSEGFEQIIDFLNTSMIQYALMQVQDDVAAAAEDEDAANEISTEPTPPSPTPATTPPPQQELIPSSSQEIGKEEKVESFRVKEIEEDADEDVTLEEVDAEKDAEVQRRLLESQAHVYHLYLEHAQKVPSMQETDKAEPSEASTLRRRGVIIQDPEKAATTSLSVQSEVKSKDKGKGILVEEPKPLKRQAQIEQDKAFARELETKLNANINWNEVIEQVKRKEKQDNTVMRYHALKRKPVTEAQARKNMMVYLKNMAGFKINFFKGMTYTDIRPIFKKHFNSIWAFLENKEKEIEEEDGKRKGKNLEQKAAKKQKIDEEVEELKTHLQIVPNDEDDVYTEATPIALKRRLRDAMEIVQERFESSKPKNFSDEFLLNTLKTMFEKPNVEASIWKNQRGRYRLAKVKSWKLLEYYGVHIITFTTTQMILLVKRRYSLTIFTIEQMLNNVRLEVEEESEVSLELLRFLKRQQQEGYKPE